MKKILITLLSLLVAVPLMAAETLNGAGASFPFPVYSSWAYSYEKETGIFFLPCHGCHGGGLRRKEGCAGKSGDSGGCVR